MTGQTPYHAFLMVMTQGYMSSGVVFSGTQVPSPTDDTRHFGSRFMARTSHKVPPKNKKIRNGKIPWTQERESQEVFENNPKSSIGRQEWNGVILKVWWCLASEIHVINENGDQTLSNPESLRQARLLLCLVLSSVPTRQSLNACHQLNSGHLWAHDLKKLRGDRHINIHDFSTAQFSCLPRPVSPTLIMPSVFKESTLPDLGDIEGKPTESKPTVNLHP